VKQPERTEAEDRRPVGADAVLHDRRLLALDPAEQRGTIQDEQHHERDAAKASRDRSGIL